MPAWLVGEGETVERLPFGPQAPRGIVWNTYLIQTSTFLAKLVEEVKTFGGSLVERSFSSVTEVEDLSQPIVVNCLGLGAGKLLSDEAVVPIRGQLIHVKPVPGRRMVVDHAGGYLISRDDILVLGGTFEEGVVDPTPSPEAVRKIWDGNKSFDWD